MLIYGQVLLMNGIINFVFLVSRRPTFRAAAPHFLCYYIFSHYIYTQIILFNVSFNFGIY